jgi:hypothetical protein
MISSLWNSAILVAVLTRLVRCDDRDELKEVGSAMVCDPPTRFYWQNLGNLGRDKTVRLGKSSW